MRPHDYILHSELLSPDDAYLMHFGVKGMKWGVRRQRMKQMKNRPLASQTVKNRRAHHLYKKMGFITMRRRA